MAGHARYTALLDANVLYPIAICDALIGVAVTGIYAPKWSAKIDEEWVRNLAEDKGFPAAALEPFGITALHPDEFLLHQLELEPLFVLPAFKSMRARLKNPLFTPEAFASSMEKNGLVQTAAFLRQALPLI